MLIVFSKCQNKPSQ